MKKVTVGAYEAKTNLGRLLDRVEEGQEVLITKHDRVVAKLSPVRAHGGRTRADALRRLDELAASVRPGPESAKDLIVAGRKL